jgi:hypothetical protein
MGRRDDPELTPSDAELAAAEERTRLLLARFGEPTAVEPPPGLADRIMAALPPARRPLRPLRRRTLGWGITAVASLLVILGLWVALGGGIAPASVAGVSSVTLLDQFTFSLATQPLDNLPSGAVLVVALGILIGGAWLWWRRARKRDGE